MNQPDVPRRRHKPLVIKLLLITAGSFAFGLALVPFYNSLCKAIGFNGKSQLEAISPTELKAMQVDTSRQITVQFTSTLMSGLPWEIRPLEPSVEVHPGELRTTKFLVRNTSNTAVTGQAVPSISPGQAAVNFKKIECFCFTQQTMGPGESREMPLTFIINPEIGRDIKEMTLAYAFFPAPAPSSSTGDKQ